MTKNIVLIIAFACLINSCASVDEQPENINSTDISNDITSLVGQLYASIEYKPDENIKPNWDVMKSLFIEDANLIHVGDTSYVKMKVQDFIDGYSEQINSGFISMASEYEIHSKGDQFGNIAQVFSTYELEGIYGGKKQGKRGINSIQLLKDDGKWKISSIIWYDENDQLLIPDAYL